ncbi:MAG: toxin TumE [bacterium]
MDSGKLEHLSYRYHFQDKNNNLIFRYDNTPHFNNLETFPHHKHLPNEVTASQRPPITEVIEEVKNNLPT